MEKTQRPVSVAQMLPGNRGADDRHAVSCQAPHLAGRDELIFFIQEDLLPKYGFEAPGCRFGPCHNWS